MLSGSLPILGVSGTTRRIGKGTIAQGRCIAKTGTLNYVTNLAGYCHSRGGHMLTFALFIDGPSNEQSIALLTKMTRGDRGVLGPGRSSAGQRVTTR